VKGDTAFPEPELEARLRRIVQRDVGADILRFEMLAEQLGTRRFYRLALAEASPASLIARIDRPEDPDNRPAGVAAEPPFEPIRALLERCGCPVPGRYGGDSGAGIELLEDLGDLSLQAAVARASADERRRLYDEACGLVPILQGVSDPGDVEAFRRRLDDELFAYKADLFARWALRAGGRPESSAEREVVVAAFGIVAAECALAPRRLAHRDFQSANLHCVPGRGLVMIDFQGAFLAPPEYDLVCLLRDSYVALPAPEIARHLERIRPLLPDAPDADGFERRFDLLTLTRKGKDVARFLQAAAERGDARYLAYVPNTLEMLQAAAARAALRDPRLAAFSELCRDLGESSCAP
jgi:aminoglycoside/choline kinase family phosphotransferase